MEQPRYQIPTLSKACRLMQVIVESEQGLSASELARRVGMARSTAFRVMRTLAHEGMVHQQGQRFLPGPGMMQIGLKSLSGTGFREQAVPVLRQLAGDTSHTAHLVVRCRDQGLILEVCDSPSVLRVASRPGSLVHIHASAAGKVLLADMPAAEAQALLERAGYERMTERTITDWQAMAAELQKTSRRGYGLDDREYHDDVRCVAAPVRDQQGAALAAVGITGPASALKAASLAGVAETVKAAASQLGEAIRRGLTDHHGRSARAG